MKLKIYSNIILNVVWYGFEILCLVLREKHKLMLCENGLLRKVFGSKKEEEEEEEEEGENGIRSTSR